MRWKHKYRDTPAHCSLRHRDGVFLWFPRVDEDKYWRWLERANIVEIWEQTYFCIDCCVAGNGDFKWRLHKVLPR